MFQLAAFIFVLGVLVLAHEFGHFLVAKLCRVRVETFSIGFGKKLLKFRRGDTQYCVSAIPLGGYVKMSGENPEEDRKGEAWEFLSKPVYQRAAIILSGPLFNYILAVVIFSLVFFIGFAAMTATIGDTVEEMPAAAAGLQSGDTIVSIDGEPVRLWQELSQRISEATSGVPVRLVVKRVEEQFAVEIVPEVVDQDNIFGEPEKVGRIGIIRGDETTIVRYAPLAAVGQGFAKTWEITSLTLQAFGKIITGKLSPRDSLHGPIGIYEFTGKAARMGFIPLLQMMALLSVSLGIINLFPIPILDGGHLLFLLIEKIRGRPVSVRSQEIAMRIGFALLMILVVFTLFNDLSRYEFWAKISRLWSGK